MITIIDKGAYLLNGEEIKDQIGDLSCDLSTAKKGTISYEILTSHNVDSDADVREGSEKTGIPANLKIKFDAMASHDITYVGIVQTARASGLNEFPVPYALTNCHNSLCAVGGTINEDDHAFGLSAAKKYGGIYVPAHLAVIHQFVREMMAGSGKMILGSDSHTRYGALGVLSMGEGGPELVKQLLSRTYNIKYPEIIGVFLKGAPRKGVGPQDVAIALIGSVFKSGFVKNKVLEFVGPGIANLSVDFRNGIDVMTTETTCLSSIWVTDEKVLTYYKTHGRSDAYKKLAPKDVAYYDGMIVIDLDQVKPMIALPFHPSNAFTIEELCQNPGDILREAEIEGAKQIDNPLVKLDLVSKIVDGKIKVDQGIVAGCAGGMYENVAVMASILRGNSTGSDKFSLSVYPASQPIYIEMVKKGIATELMVSGAVLKTAFCGPCFGAGDTPANNELSIRHTTRNFPSREGSKPGSGQLSSVALMDARSIAATAATGGYLTSAADVDYADVPEYILKYNFDKTVYDNRIYQGYGKPDASEDLVFGPNIIDWPAIPSLSDNILLKVASVILDPVTTTDELIPSGETSSYRSNPMKLAEFTLSRKDPEYVDRAKALQAQTDLAEILVKADPNAALDNTGIGSVIYANRPGDGSAREQAASCQRVLGGAANICIEYATKRYRSNLINWGMLPFTLPEGFDEIPFELNDYIFIKDIKTAITSGAEKVDVVVLSDAGVKGDYKLDLLNLTAEDRDIILSGCLMNYYRDGK